MSTILQNVESARGISGLVPAHTLVTARVVLNTSTPPEHAL